MLKFDEVPFEVLLKEGEELFKEDWEELGADKQVFQLAPNYGNYFDLEEVGMLQCVAVRDGDKLVGYAVFYIYSSPHSRGQKMASADVIFLSKPYRKGWNGVHFIRECEKTFKNTTIKKLTIPVTKFNNWGKVLEHEGWEPQQTLYTKIIG